MMGVFVACLLACCDGWLGSGGKTVRTALLDVDVYLFIQVDLEERKYRQ